jgi:hypothetical protein
MEAGTALQMIIYKYSHFLKNDHADCFGVSSYVQLLAYIYTMTRVDTGSKFSCMH